MVAVVVTLVYLAKQIRHSSLSSRSATTLEASRMIAECMRGVSQTPDLAQVWYRSMTDPDALSDEEVARVIWVNAGVLHVIEGMWRQSKMGLVEAEAMRPLERFVGQLVNNPIVGTWWDSEIDLLSEEFRDYVNGIRARNLDPDYAERVAQSHRPVPGR